MNFDETNNEPGKDQIEGLGDDEDSSLGSTPSIPC